MVESRLLNQVSNLLCVPVICMHSQSQRHQHSFRENARALTWFAAVRI